MENFSLSGQIKLVLKALNLTQTSLASKLGLSQGVISEFASGAREPSKEFLIGLPKLGVSLDWFLSGEGEMLLAPLPAKAGNGYKVPLLRQKVSCGPGVEWQDDNNIVEYIDVFDQIPRLKIERLFAFCVEGSSMLGAGIRNGDYVLFNSAKDQWVRDGIYVFALDGEVYCKRLEFDMSKIKIYSVRFADLDQADLMVTLDSEDISTADRLTIFGRVLYWIHPNLDD
jgi:transcriptional regulator with XRE-family HTH domain